MRLYARATRRVHRAEPECQNFPAAMRERRAVYKPPECAQDGQPQRSPSCWTAPPWPPPAPAFARRLASGSPWPAEVPVEESLPCLRSCFRRKRQVQRTTQSQGTCEPKGKTRRPPDKAHPPEESGFGPESYE